MAMNLKLIDNFDDFLSLKKPWNLLVSSTEVDHAFMKHEWFECWIKNLGQGGKLAIQTAWQDDKLVGIAPLHIVRRKRKGMPLRLLAFLHSSITPRCNFILHHSIDCRSFFDSLFKVKGWDIMELRSLDREQQTTRQFIEYLKATRQYVIEDGIQSPYEILNMDWKTYLEMRSKKYRQNLRLCLNRLKKAQSYEVVLVRGPQEFTEHIDTLIAISNKSWKSKEGTDLLTDRRSAGFYRDFSSYGGDHGLCTAYIFYINGKPAGFDYYLNHERRLVALRWDFDEEYRHFMPGIFLHHFVIKSSIESGQVWEFDTSGAPTQAKTAVANRIRSHIDVTVGRPGFPGRLLIHLKKALMKRHELQQDAAKKTHDNTTHDQG